MTPIEIMKTTFQIHKINLCCYSGEVKSLNSFFFKPAGKVLTCVGMWNNELRIMRAEFNFFFLHSSLCIHASEHLCVCERERMRGCAQWINAAAHVFL